MQNYYSLILIALSLNCFYSFEQEHKFLLKSTLPCFGLVFDGGSSSTKLSIYNWDCRQSFTIPAISISADPLTQKVSPGIATFANNIGGIQAYLKPLFDYASGNVPQEQKQYTPILFGGTAGMRILSKDAQTAILNEVSRIFKTLPYLFDSANPQWCQVIDGQLQGAFMWLTVNYALGKIKKTIESQLEMVSIIDLGGASTQITYVPPLATLAADKNLEIVLQNYNNYNLFSTSFLGWGNDMIRNNIIENYSVKWTDQIYENSCLFRGYVGQWDKDPTVTLYGNGDVPDCLQNLKILLNNQNCKVEDIDRCGINNTHFPKIPADVSIYALNGVHTASDILKLGGSFQIQDFYTQMISYCTKPWSQIIKEQTEDSYLYSDYILTAYTYVLLSDGYKLGDTTTVDSPDHIGSITPTWALGFLMYELGNVDCKDDSPDCNKQILERIRFIQK